MRVIESGRAGCFPGDYDRTGSMLVAIKVKPNARTEEVIEEADGFTVRVKEPPVEGRANKAVVKLMAKHLNVPESHVRIVKGFKSKTKIVEVVER